MEHTSMRRHRHWGKCVPCDEPEWHRAPFVHSDSEAVAGAEVGDGPLWIHGTRGEGGGPGPECQRMIITSLWSSGLGFDYWHSNSVVCEWCIITYMPCVIRGLRVLVLTLQRYSCIHTFFFLAWIWMVFMRMLVPSLTQIYQIPDILFFPFPVPPFQVLNAKCSLLPAFVLLCFNTLSI